MLLLFSMHTTRWMRKYVDDAKRRKKSKINKLKIKLQSNQKGARGRLSSSRRQHGRKHPPRRRPPTAEGRPPTADRRPLTADPLPPRRSRGSLRGLPPTASAIKGWGTRERERESAGVEDCVRARRRSGTAPPDPPSLPSSGSWRQVAGGRRRAAGQGHRRLAQEARAGPGAARGWIYSRPRSALFDSRPRDEGVRACHLPLRSTGS